MFLFKGGTISILSFFVSITLYSQSPGGVSSNIELWYKANDGVVSGVSGVTTWTDRSGNGINGTGTGASAPQFISNALNNNPVVRFDGSDRINTSLNINSSTIPNLDVIAIYKPTDANPGAVFGEDNYGWDRFLMSKVSTSTNLNNVISAGSTGANVQNSLLFQLNKPHITAISWKEDISNGSKYYINGKEEGTFSANNGPQTTNTLQIGDIGNSVYPFIGDIAEIIVYSNTKSDNERQRIESYLAIKYGISLNQSSGAKDYLSSGGTVIWNGTSNSAYNKGIAGIGRDDNSGLNHASSKNENESGILAINSPSSFSSDNTFLIWGHNDGSASNFVASQAPSSYPSRLTRIWRATSTGSIGSVNVSMNISNSGNSNDYALLIDNSDADFSSGATIHTSGVSINGNTITFTGVTLSNGAYFTLGFNGAAVINNPAPGGVSSDLALWYKANDGVVSGGSTVTSWEDKSGNSINGTVNGSGVQHVSGGLNNNAVVRFGGSGRINTSLSINSGTYPNVDVITVYKPTNSSPGGVLGEDNGNWDRFFLHSTSASHLINTVSNGTTYESSSELFPINESVISTISWREDVSNGSKCYVRGRQVLSFSSNHGPETSNTVQIGDIGTNLYPFRGDIAEVIVFNSTQSSNERQRIDSYLAIKYGVSLDQSSGAYNYLSSSGTVIWNGTTNNTYNKSIAGIGRDDYSALNQLKSVNQNESGILEIQAASLSTDQTFLVWGHNNGDLNTNDNIPGSLSTRTNRVWKLQETGETGNLTIHINVSGMSSAPSSASDFVLLVDNDTDFSNATSIVASSISSNIVTFNNVNLSDGQYISLGGWRAIIWNAGAYTNGSGSAGAPNTSDATRKLYIQSGNATLPENANVRGVEVTSGTSLTIQSGRYLQTDGDIINNGSFVIQNSGALVQTRTGANSNSGSGTYKVQRTGGSNTLTYDAWGSPVTNQSLLGSGGIFDGANPCDIYTFVGSTQLWKYDYSNGFSTTCKGNAVTFGNTDVITGGDGLMDQARGYFAPGASASTREFAGTINNGDISVNVSTGPNPNLGWTGDNWNLISNPYPSGLNALSFVTANSSVITGNIYLWDQNSATSLSQSEYVVWNAAGTVNQNVGSASTFGTIGSGQGFFVEATTSGSVSFNNAMRSTSNNTFFKYKKNDFGRIRITAINPLGKTIQQLIAFHKDATDQRDNLFDAKYMEGEGKHQFYSLLNNQPMIIQTFNNLKEGEQKIIPLGLKTKITGKFSFLLDKVENIKADIVLYDSLEMKAHDLKKAIPQIIIDSAQTYSNRFFLMVRAQKDTTGQGGNSNNVDDKTTNDWITIQKEENHLIVKSIFNIKNVNVSDVLGRKIVSTNSGRQIKIPLNFKHSQMIFINIQMKNRKVIRKKYFW